MIIHDRKQALSSIMSMSKPDGSVVDSPAEEKHDENVLETIAGELIEAVHSKDKLLLVEALKALMTAIAEEDKEQDEGSEPEGD